MTDRTAAAAVPSSRRIERVRRLPSGRAVVGGLLVALAALTVVVSYLGAIAPPVTSYLVAAEVIEPGTRFEDPDQLRAALGQVAVELPPATAATVVAVADVDELLGATVTVALERGELLTWSMLDRRVHDRTAHTVSFPIAPADAVAGALTPGDLIDVIVTDGGSRDAVTRFVAREVRVLAVAAPETAGPVGGQQVLTVGLDDAEDVLALSHGLATGQVRLARTVADTGASEQEVER